MKKNNYCTIYLVRHGECEGNTVDRLGGDTQLTSKGKLQALELGKEFKNIDFSAVFSSKLLRAEQTAQLIIEGRGLSVHKVENLRERHFGKIDGQPVAEYIHLFDAVKNKPDKEHWKLKIVDDMESAQEALTRFSKVLREIVNAYLGKKILIVAHGTVMRALLVSLGYCSFRDLPAGSLKNTGYIKLESDGDKFFIKETKGVEVRGKERENL
ncbi:MAG: histidine phosphatase family protein [Patescibacteria group bacterium]|nr:histidine phosphatase family protein [Patescibacteria group bacterium]